MFLWYLVEYMDNFYFYIHSTIMTLDNYLLIVATCILATLKPDSRLKIRNS